jgi:hypothetical protein
MKDFEYIVYYWDAYAPCYISGVDTDFNQGLMELIERFGIPNRIKRANYQG